MAAQATPDIAKVRDLYYQGIYGDKKAAEQADALFTSLHERTPADPLITVYFGSLRLMEAQHTLALWKKYALSKAGVLAMDGAVAARPADLEIRFVRAATERQLPGFFGRKQQAKADLEVIVKGAEEAARQGTLQPRLAAASFFYYGLDCQEESKKQEALNAWRTAVRIAPESHAGREAAGRLAGS